MALTGPSPPIGTSRLTGYRFTVPDPMAPASAPTWQRRARPLLGTCSNAQIAAFATETARRADRRTDMRRRAPSCTVVDFERVYGLRIGSALGPEEWASRITSVSMPAAT